MMPSTNAEKEYYRQYRLLHKEQKKAYNTEYFKTERYREWNRNRHRKEKDKYAARAFVRIRVQRGTLQRQPCTFCGLPNGHAHHEDYTKQNEIVWVCPQHHADIHRGMLKPSHEHLFTIDKRRQKRLAPL